MSDATADLIRRAHESRREWVEVEPGVSLHIQRPPIGMIPALDAAVICGFVIGWRGVTLGHLLGDAATEAERAAPVEFSEALRDATMPDNGHWIVQVANAVRAAVKRREKALEAARGN